MFGFKKEVLEVMMIVQPGHQECKPGVRDAMEEDREPPKTRLMVIGSQGTPEPFEWPNALTIQTRSWGRRILCSSSGPRAEFLLRILSRYPGPFSVSYILEDNSGVSKYRKGRYGSRTHLTFDQVIFFIHEFEELLFKDGRHHLMLLCRGSDGVIFYDQHDYFFVYGKVDSLAEELRREGFIDCDYKLGQHGHVMRDDVTEIHRLMSYWSWKYSSLEATDVTREHVGLWQYLYLKLRAKWFDMVRRAPE